MGKRDPRVDEYVARSAAFAQPLLRYLREVIHEACPQAEEALKWSMPAFLYRGRILCGMAAFKQHCAFWFWRGRTLAAADQEKKGSAMGQFGRIVSRKDLPPKKALGDCVKQAMKLDEDGAQAGKRNAKRKPPAVVPADLLAALKQNPRAQATFAAFSASAKREYIDWIVEAKRDDTRAKRVAQAIEWMAAGKQRNWKYMNR